MTQKKQLRLELVSQHLYDNDTIKFLVLDKFLRKYLNLTPSF